MARRKVDNQISFDMDNDGNLENIIEKPLEAVLPESIMPYSEYVILERALPRVEDGLKPVQRRVLYSMHELGVLPNKEYKKSARIVGDCLGKYHPHGDTSVYDAMVRMAQDFTMRMCLVDGQGNFGSVDGDSAAAMRYTEVRMAPLATELLRDLDEDTVEWQNNFDDQLQEPRMLPGRFPNLLVNGAEGIAIGVATKIPPHNLGEVIDAVVAMIDNPRITLTELLTIVKGPDFPTGGFLIPGDSLEEVYSTGKGKLIMRAKVDIENGDNDKQNIIVTEIPYQVNKAALQQSIFSLKEQNKDKLGGISEIADESDANGMRIVLKLKKGEDPVKIINFLFKKTDLQKNFPVNIMAIAGGKPQQMGLVAILKYYINYQRTVILKRTQHKLGNAKKRENILKGFVPILPSVRELVDITFDSKNRTESKARIRARFELNEAQADAILDTKVGALNQLDIDKYYKELDALEKDIAAMEKIVGSQREQLNVVKKEILEIKNKYKSKRLTTVVSTIDEIEIKAYDPSKRNARRGIVTISPDGLVKFITPTAFYKDNRAADNCTRDTLVKSLALVEPAMTAIVFGSKGNAYRIDTNTIKESKWAMKGQTLKEAFGGDPSEKAVAVLTVTDGEKDVKVFASTASGMVKASMMSEYIINKDSYQYAIVKDDDEIISVEKDAGLSTIVYVSTDGQALNCLKDEIPVQGRKSAGVIAMKLEGKERVVYAGQCEAEYETDDEIVSVGELLVMTNNGVGRKSFTRSYRPMQRARKGVKALDLPQGEKVIFATTILTDFDIAVVNKIDVVKSINTEDIRLNDRTQRAYHIFDEDDYVLGVSHIEELK